jgi:hypothetical protein
MNCPANGFTLSGCFSCLIWAAVVLLSSDVNGLESLVSQPSSTPEQAIDFPQIFTLMD